jgi:tetratricopeptide (TPR) repeat protein
VDSSTNTRPPEFANPTRNFNAAQILLEGVVHRIDKKVGQNGRDVVVGATDVLEAWPLRLVRAEAQCALAMSHAERNGDLEAARSALKRAEDVVDEDALSEYVSKYPERAGELKAHYHHAEGRIRIQEGDLEAGIEALNKSIACESDAEVYLDLAEAYWVKAVGVPDPERRLFLSRSQAYCTLVQATDLRGLCGKQLEDLSARLKVASQLPERLPAIEVNDRT